jgi:hypothetical protein
MSDLSFSQATAQIAVSRMSKDDKLFILENWETALEVIGEECLNIPKAHIDTLTQDVSSNTCAKARKRQCETMVVEMTARISKLKTDLRTIKENIEAPPCNTNASFVDLIWLEKSEYGQGLCINFHSEDVSKIEKFKFLCEKNIHREMMAFHQENTRTYQMFDVWYPNRTVIDALCSAFAAEIGVTFSSVSDIPAVDVIPMKDIAVIQYVPFDETKHVFDDFSESY